jgi:hypothetical protein
VEFAAASPQLQSLPKVDRDPTGVGKSRAYADVNRYFHALLAIVAFVPPLGASVSCDNLGSLRLAQAKVTTAELVAAGDFTPPSSQQPIRDLPPFCRVAATPAPSADSNIQIEVWMPVSGWNGKLLAVGNGGWSGAINYGGLAAWTGHDRDIRLWQFCEQPVIRNSGCRAGGFAGGLDTPSRRWGLVLCLINNWTGEELVQQVGNWADCYLALRTFSAPRVRTTRLYHDQPVIVGVAPKDCRPDRRSYQRHLRDPDYFPTSEPEVCGAVIGFGPIFTISMSPTLTLTYTLCAGPGAEAKRPSPRSSGLRYFPS